MQAVGYFDSSNTNGLKRYDTYFIQYKNLKLPKSIVVMLSNIVVGGGAFFLGHPVWWFANYSY